jgi:hypothetical protein
MVSGDWRLFVPDTAPGEVAASPRNPIVTPGALRACEQKDEV